MTNTFPAITDITSESFNFDQNFIDELYKATQDPDSTEPISPYLEVWSKTYNYDGYLYTVSLEVCCNLVKSITGKVITIPVANGFTDRSLKYKLTYELVDTSPIFLAQVNRIRVRRKMNKLPCAGEYFISDYSSHSLISAFNSMNDEIEETMYAIACLKTDIATIELNCQETLSLTSSIKEANHW